MVSRTAASLMSAADGRSAAKVSRKVNRLHVTVPESLQSRIDEMADASHATSTAEVFRNALTIYAALLDAHLEGKQVIMQKPDGSERERLRLFI